MKTESNNPYHRVYMGLLRKISLINDLKSYRKEYFKFDLMAGLTVAIVALPQSMAYALIAGVNPVYGLYTSIVAAIIGSLFGSSDHLITGPTNAISLMIASQVQHFAHDNFLAMFFLLTFLVGAIQFLLGLLRVGKIINFVSHAVIVGFTAGAGIIIALGQIDQFFGISVAKGYHPLYEKVWLTLAAFGKTNLYSLGLAVLTVAIILISKKISKNIPGALIGIIAGAIIVKIHSLANYGVKLIGDIPNHLPPFQLMNTFKFHWLFDLMGGAAAIAIVGLVEAISISKSISLSTGQKIEPNREFIGQGLANMIAAFFRCFPSSGSFTRSAINFGAGAKSKLAGIISGIIVAITFIFLAPFARYIPNASLAGVIIVVAYNMMNKHAIRKIVKASKYDLSVMAVTIAATVLMPDLERAILIGIAVSVIVYLWNTGEIKVKLLKQDGKSTFKEFEIRDEILKDNPTGITLVHIEGDLYFGSANNLEEKLSRMLDDPNTTTCILRLKRITVIDISAFEVVENFIERWLKKDRKVLLCGVGVEMKKFLEKLGIIEMVGAENVFMAEDQVFASTGRAFQKAKMMSEAG
jgi:sulfate permease, SulP family